MKNIQDVILKKLPQYSKNQRILVKDCVITAQGFGISQNVIIDQHFIKEKRLNRLLATVIQNQMLGLGIAESTALWIKPDNEVEVLGERSVIHLDPQGAQFHKNTSAKMLAVQNLILCVFLSGDKFTLTEGM